MEAGKHLILLIKVDLDQIAKEMRKGWFFSSSFKIKLVLFYIFLIINKSYKKTKPTVGEGEKEHVTQCDSLMCFY